MSVEPPSSKQYYTFTFNDSKIDITERKGSRSKDALEKNIAEVNKKIKDAIKQKFHLTTSRNDLTKILSEISTRIEHRIKSKHTNRFTQWFARFYERNWGILAKVKEMQDFVSKATLLVESPIRTPSQEIQSAKLEQREIIEQEKPASPVQPLQEATPIEEVVAQKKRRRRKQPQPQVEKITGESKIERREIRNKAFEIINDLLDHIQAFSEKYPPEDPKQLRIKHLWKPDIESLQERIIQSKTIDEAEQLLNEAAILSAKLRDQILETKRSEALSAVDQLETDLSKLVISTEPIVLASQKKKIEEFRDELNDCRRKILQGKTIEDIQKAYPTLKISEYQYTLDGLLFDYKQARVNKEAELLHTYDKQLKMLGEQPVGNRKYWQEYLKDKITIPENAGQVEIVKLLDGKIKRSNARIQILEDITNNLEMQIKNQSSGSKKKVNMTNRVNNSTNNSQNLKKS